MRKRKAFADKELDDITLQNEISTANRTAQSFSAYPPTKNLIGSDKMLFPGFHFSPYSTLYQTLSAQTHVASKNSGTLSKSPSSVSNPYLSKDFPPFNERLFDSSIDNTKLGCESNLSIDTPVSRDILLQTNSSAASSENDKEHCGQNDSLKQRKRKSFENSHESKVMNQLNKENGVNAETRENYKNKQVSTDVSPSGIDQAFRYHLISNFFPKTDSSKSKYTSPYVHEANYANRIKEEFRKLYPNVGSSSSPYSPFELLEEQTKANFYQPFLAPNYFNFLSPEIQRNASSMNKENALSFGNPTSVLTQGLDSQLQLNQHWFEMQKSYFLNSFCPPISTESSSRQAEHWPFLFKAKNQIHFEHSSKPSNFEEPASKKTKQCEEKPLNLTSERCGSADKASKSFFQEKDFIKNYQNRTNVKLSETEWNRLKNYQSVFENKTQNFKRYPDLDFFQSSLKPNIFNSTLKTTQSKITPFTVQSIIGKATA